MQSEKIGCKNCGSDEFITGPNSYEVYKFVNNELQMIERLLIDDIFRLNCRECGVELKDANHSGDDES